MSYETNKEYAAKWDRENMATCACKVKKSERDAFKAWAESHGLTVSGALLAYIRSCISND